MDSTKCNIEANRWMKKDIHLVVAHKKHDYLRALIDEDKNIVFKTNKRGETALHVACRDPLGIICYEQLIAAHADINARNKWGQTPLHEAARLRCMPSIESLLQNPNINANAIDCNGYNALHVLISTLENDEFAVGDKVCVPENVKQGMRLFVAAGIDINSQSNWGQSILHMASRTNYPIEYSTYLLTEYPSLDVFMVNKMGETFLEFVEWLWWIRTDEVLTFLEIIELKHKGSVKTLLNTKNKLGIQYWFTLLEYCSQNYSLLESMLDRYQIDVNSTDNLGNNALHYLVRLNTHKMEWLITAGINTKCRNIFGQTPAFSLFEEDDLSVFLKHEVDLNIEDRWQRTPFMHTANQNPNLNVLSRMITDGQINLNAKDIQGSTALHFAAYNGFEEQVKLLLPLLNTVDKLKETPLQTAKHNQKFNVCKLLDDTDVIYRRDKSSDLEFETVLLCKLSEIKLSEMYSAKHLGSLVGVPADMEMFSEYLLKTKHLTLARLQQGEQNDILTELRQFVQTLCDIIGGYDQRFAMTVFPTGSTVEGTKAGRPDEFDYVLCLEAVNKVFEPSMPEDVINGPHACLKFNESIKTDDFRPFIDEDGFFLPLPFLHYLFRYFKMAMHETRLWKNGNFLQRFEDRFHVIDAKPVFNVDIYWLGSRFKQLKISVDLVPAVFKQGWIHWDLILSGSIIKEPSGETIGPLLLLQTEVNDFDKQKFGTFNENICSSCNTLDDYNRRHPRRNLRISVAPPEIHFMKSLPEVFRKAYAFAKIMKSDICPEIMIDDAPYNIQGMDHDLKKELSNVKSVKSSEVLKSYMLKNCLFYIADEMKNDPGNLTPIQITIKIYERLLRILEAWTFEPFFLRTADIFYYEYQAKMSSGQRNAINYPRYLCVNLILALLGKDFNRKQLAKLPVNQPISTVKPVWLNDY